MKARWRIAGLLLAVACAAHPDDAALPTAPMMADTPDAFGPFRMGMSMDEAVAIAPGFEWYEARSQQTDRVFSVTAADGWHLDARNYDVTLTPGYYGAYRLEVEHAVRAGSADECREGVRALMVEFERRYGELEVPGYMQSQLGPGRVSVQRSAEGYPMVVGTPGDVVREASPTMQVGRESEAGVGTIEGDVPGAAYWAAVRAPTRAQPWKVQVDGRFSTRDSSTGDASNGDASTGDTSTREGAPTCEIRGQLVRDGEVPEVVQLDTAHVPLAEQPSVGLLHHSLDGVAALPAEGISVDMQCSVSRASGALRGCAPVGSAPTGAGVLKAVGWRLRATRFDAHAIDERDPAPLSARITVRLLPSDRIDIGPPPAVLRAQREVRWAQRPTGADLERAYPPQLLRDGAQASVKASCRIQQDLSVVCVDARVAPADGTDTVRQFSLAAYEVLTNFHARPLLADDVTPAIGEWFTASVAFRVAD